MGCSEGTTFCTGCAFCLGWMAWIGVGVWASVEAFDAASECGWWLWGTFIAQLVYVPFAIIFHAVYLGAIWTSCANIEGHGESTGSGMADGCLRGGGFFFLNIVGGAIVGTSGHALWGAPCDLSGTVLREMAQVGFFVTAVLLGASVIAGIADGVRMCIKNCVD